MRLVTSKLAFVLAGAAALAAAGTYLATADPTASSTRTRQAVMYKPLRCGCCDDYAKYLGRNGIEVEIYPMRSLDEIRRASGVPAGFEGCHTLLVDGYVVDGLVPITTLTKLLTEKPAIRGITLPGMPWGAPGMEQRPKSSPLVVYAFEDGGNVPRVYATE